MVKRSRKDRSLTLRIGGAIGKDGKVPVALLAAKLESAQRTLLSIGTEIARGGTRGKHKNLVMRACELDFVSATKKCLEVTMEIPPREQLFEEEDIGLQSLEKLTETISATEKRDRAKIEKLYPDQGQRTRVLRAAMAMLPEEESDYTVQLSANGEFHELTEDLSSYLSELSRPPEPQYYEDSIRTLTGILYLIEVETGKRRIGIIMENRHIPCYFPPELEPLVKDLIPGSLVEVKGKVSLTETGQIKEIEEVIDALQIQLVPLYWTRLIYGDRKFIFRDRCVINVDFQDGVWSHENEYLGIFAYGETRAESLDAFRDEFTACYDSIAQEDDKNLTADAIHLKKRLQKLIKSVEVVS